MKIPRSVFICGQKFSIEYRDNIREDGDNCLGLCKTDELKIYLRKNLPHGREDEVFLHECLHGIDELLELKIGERRINTLGLLLLDFLKTNKLHF